MSTVTKKYHKKSKKGCQRCKVRRVKCDEIYPCCGNCHRHGVACSYERQSSNEATEDNESNLSHSDRRDRSTSRVRNQAVSFLPESRDRRLLELRLLSHYSARTILTIQPAIGDQEEVKISWNSWLAKLAFSSDACLYSALAVAAAHISISLPSDLEALEARKVYLDAAIHEHRLDIDNLNAANADAVCLVSSNLQILSFTLLQQGAPDPYSPPIQWFRMVSGALQVFREVWKWIADDENSVARQMVKQMKYLEAPGSPYSSYVMDPSHEFFKLQGNNHQKPELVDVKVKEAYLATLNYLSYIKNILSSNQEETNPKAVIEAFRKLVFFPAYVHPLFLELLEEQRPRALAILAHYFALLLHFNEIWWIGDSGVHQIKAINAILSFEWTELIEWPMAIMERGWPTTVTAGSGIDIEMEG